MVFNTGKDEAIAKAVLADLENHRKIRNNYKSNQQEALDYFCPRRGNLDDMVTKGDKRGNHLYNSVGVQALSDWVAGYMGNHITASEPWFDLNPAMLAMPEWLITDRVADYFQRTTPAMFTLLSNTNFYTEMPNLLKDGGSWGTAVQDIEYDKKIIYRTMHPRESYIIPDKRNSPNGYMREWSLEAVNAVDEFSLENLSDSFQQVWKQDNKDPYLKDTYVLGYYHKSHPIAQLITPRPDREYVLLTIQKNNTHLVKIEYRDRLLPIWRPEYETDEIYGRSPAMNATKDAKMGNEFSQADIGAAQLSVQPMMNVHKKNRHLNQFRPWGEHIFDNPNEKTTPVSNGINYPIGVDREDRLARAVQDHFSIPLFKFLTSFAEREMTAREVVERKGEQVRLISTQLNSLNMTLNDSIEITFGLGFKNNLIPTDVPQELVDFTKGSLDIARMIDYTGPLAMIQKTLFRTQSTDFALERLAVKAQLGGPDILDVVDWDKSAREDLKADGFPVRHLADPRAIAAIRAQRAEQQAIAQQMAMRESEAKVLKDTKHLQTA